MSPVRTMRLLIVGQVVALVLTIAVDAATQGALPAQLQAYLAEVEASELTPASTAVGLLGLLAIVASVISWIGLWRLWRPARSVYAVALLSALVITLFTGPVVWSGVVGTIDDVASIVAGMLLGLLYSSDLRQHFDPRAA